MIQYNIDISNKEDVELAMQDLYSISKGRNYELKFFLKEEYDSLFFDKKSLELLYEKMKEEYKKMENDSYEKIEELDSLQSKYQKVESENEQLKKKLDDLKKQCEVMTQELAKYSTSYGVENPTENILFKVEYGMLKETRDRARSHYIANREGDKYKYRFYESGPEVQACTDRQNYLDPFCEVVSSVEGANRIEHKEMGYLEIIGSVVNIKQKCKINLIKV